MPVPDDYAFEATSPVGRYWLVNGIGFTVCRADGRELGVVEDVVVDPVRQCADEVIVRRRGIFLRRKHVTISAGAVAAVAPATRRFVVRSATTSQAAVAPAPRPAATAIRRAGAASGLLVEEMLRGAGRVSRGIASASARAAVAADERARREAPRLDAWLAARSRAAVRALVAAGRALGTAARATARVLGELAVLAAVVVAGAWRRLATPTPREATPSPEEAPHSLNDADAPLSREPSDEVPRRSSSAERARPRR